MIVTTPDAFREQLEGDWMIADSPGVPRAVFLVEPADFALSRQAARDNSYMDLTVGVNPDLALRQHRELTDRIAECGVPVIRFPGRTENPDDLFPNNVFATIPGRFIVGAMLNPERRQEAQRNDIRAFFTELMHYQEVDLSKRDLVAELTGAVVLDRARRLGFCGLSHRVDEAGCAAMHKAFELALTFRFELKPDGLYVNRQRVEEFLHTDAVDAWVAQVSSVSDIRTVVNRDLRQVASGLDSVVEGRDITTVVFPDAKVKIFLDASVETRAKRRYHQGISELSIEEIAERIRQRDQIDRTKAVGRLEVAEDAIYLDTSDLTIDQVCEKVIDKIRKTAQ